jgi:hypothetical protein
MTTANARALNREKRARKQSSRSAQRKAVDVAFSLWVRSIGVCELAHVDGEIWVPGTNAFECSGVLQCCHVFTRGYSRTRWSRDPLGALCGCTSHHVYYTHRPAHWELFIVAKLGQAHWDELRRLAITPAPTPDYRELLAEIRSWEPRA